LSALALTALLALADEPAPLSSPEAPQARRDVPVLERLEVPQQPRTRPPGSRRQRLHRALTRPVARSARYLDHGVLAVNVGLGTPHVYRLELSLGLLDHLTLGATAHWLPGQRAPNWSPKASVAVLRGRLVEVGMFYTQVLYPATPDDGDDMTVEFQRRAHFVMGSVSLSQAWFTAGLDLGWARGREAIDLMTSEDADAGRIYAVRDRLGGGLHLRFGTRRIGVTAQVMHPYTSAELVLDLRFGLFELRRRGGWWDL
jgi:hypothetical protein